MTRSSSRRYGVMGGGQLIMKMRLRPPLEPLKNVKGQCEIKQVRRLMNTRLKVKHKVST